MQGVILPGHAAEQELELCAGKSGRRAQLRLGIGDEGQGAGGGEGIMIGQTHDEIVGAAGRRHAGNQPAGRQCQGGRQRLRTVGDGPGVGRGAVGALQLIGIGDPGDGVAQGSGRDLQ